MSGISSSMDPKTGDLTYYSKDSQYNIDQVFKGSFFNTIGKISDIIVAYAMREKSNPYASPEIDMMCHLILAIVPDRSDLIEIMKWYDVKVQELDKIKTEEGLTDESYNRRLYTINMGVISKALEGIQIMQKQEIMTVSKEEVSLQEKVNNKVNIINQIKELDTKKKLDIFAALKEDLRVHNDGSNE